MWVNLKKELKQVINYNENLKFSSKDDFDILPLSPKFNYDYNFSKHNDRLNKGNNNFDENINSIQVNDHEREKYISKRKLYQAGGIL